MSDSEAPAPVEQAPKKTTAVKACRLCRHVRTLSKASFKLAGHRKSRRMWVCKECAEPARRAGPMAKIKLIEE